MTTSLLFRIKQQSEKTYLTWFSIWFLLFPFDAFILPVSIGFMTVYPFLLLTFGMLAWSFFLDTQTQLPKHLKWALVYVFLLPIVGLIHLPFVPGKTEAIFDIRSLIMQAATISLLFRTYLLYGNEAFFTRIQTLAVVIFTGLSVAAWFEYLTGIHLQGAFTDKLLHLPASNVTYSAVFLYDNPNTFLCYLFSLAVIIFLTGKHFRESLINALPILSQLLFFSIIADSKFGRLIAIILLIYFGAVSTNWQQLFRNKVKLGAAGIFVICVLIVALSKPLYYGPMWKNGSDYTLNYIHVLSEKNGRPVFESTDSLVSKYGKEKILRAYYNKEMAGRLESTETRKNLILNGIWLFQQHPLTGAGPGQFRWFSTQKQMPNATNTINSPHESFTELLSQFGILIILIMFSVFFWVMTRMWKYRKTNWKFAAIWFLILPIYWTIGAMPSAWLVLNCGWMMLGIVLLSPEQFIPQRAR